MSSINKEMNKLKTVPPTRREFLYLTASAFGIVGLGAAVVPFIHSMNPAADVLSLASVDVDIHHIGEGQTVTIMWRGKPVFVRHRTKEEIEKARQVPLKSLIDPQLDEERFKKNPTWLVVVGVCTHLGCIPTQQKGMTSDAEKGGWICSCHGSIYDVSGRVIRGPAPKNLEVPDYQFVNDATVIRIG